MGTIRIGDLEQIKLILSLTDTSQDTLLTDLNQQVSNEVEQYCFGENVVGFLTVGGPEIDDLVEYHDGGLDAVVVRRDIDPKTAVRDAVEVVENEITLVTGTDYFIPAHPSRTIYRLVEAENFNAVFSAGRRNVRVTYTAASEAAPQAVVRVVNEETARAFLLASNDSTEGGNLAISQRSPDSGDAVTYRADDWSAHTIRILDLFRDDLVKRFF